ncbi:MAG TPA: hypothetical protein VF540_07495 [Segetibacter sp.]
MFSISLTGRALPAPNIQTSAIQNVARNAVTALFTSDFLNFESMSTVDINTMIIEGYLQMLDNLSPSNKLDLISKLSASVKSDIKNKKPTFKRAFGAFQSEKSADEIINEIRSSRTFTRQIEDF